MNSDYGMRAVASEDRIEQLEQENGALWQGQERCIAALAALRATERRVYGNDVDIEWAGRCGAEMTELLASVAALGPKLKGDQ